MLLNCFVIVKTASELSNEGVECFVLFGKGVICSWFAEEEVMFRICSEKIRKNSKEA